MPMALKMDIFCSSMPSGIFGETSAYKIANLFVYAVFLRQTNAMWFTFSEKISFGNGWLILGQSRVRLNENNSHEKCVCSLHVHPNRLSCK